MTKQNFPLEQSTAATAGNAHELPASSQAVTERKRGERRRFIGGLGAALPAILTITSRSALATGECFSPSAQASIDLMNSHNNASEELFCAGRSPSYWKYKETAKTVSADRVMFETVFGDGFDRRTMRQVMKLEDNGERALQTNHGGADDDDDDDDGDHGANSERLLLSSPSLLPSQGSFERRGPASHHGHSFSLLARYLAAAWCNLQAGLVPASVIDLPTLQAMWAGRYGNSFTPVAGGQPWSDQEMIDYLKTTMTD